MTDQTVLKRSASEIEQPCKKPRKRLATEKTEEELILSKNIDDPSQEEEITAFVDAREKNVGITEYISQHEGFSAILKQRYSDFVVNERSLDGRLIELNDLSFPDLFDKIDDIFSTDVKEKLQKLEESRDEKASVEIEVGDDKEYRTKIHHAIRKLFSNLESNTEEIEKRKIIRVMVTKKSGKSRKAWPSEKGNYCHFVLYKENKDTMEAINIIAKKLGIKPGAFTFAGTKDRRAKTSQKISVYRLDPIKLKRLNNQLQDICVGNFNFGKEALKLGDLSGNHFKIILRDVKGNDDVIGQAMASLKRTGFINYYGMQRFGTTAIGTHKVGSYLLRGLWSEAVDLILKPRKGENSSQCEWRKYWQETKNAKKSLEKLSRRNSIEFHLLQGLVHHGNNIQGALTFIPRNSRLMYVHSYQSFIWNTIVSRRLKKFGLQPIEGDLVEVNKEKNIEENSDLLVQTIEAAETANYTLHDILLPLPGYNIIYPKNEVGEWYKELLDEDKIELNSKSKIRDYSLPGAYRKIIVHPQHFSWSIMDYNDANESLILSDKDKINGLTEPENISGGHLKALRLEFSLPSSSYATMLIREVLKVDTSSSYQCTLNPPSQVAKSNL